MMSKHSQIHAKQEAVLNEHATLNKSYNTVKSAVNITICLALTHQSWVNQTWVTEQLEKILKMINE